MIPPATGTRPSALARSACRRATQGRREGGEGPPAANAASRLVPGAYRFVGARGAKLAGMRMALRRTLAPVQLGFGDGAPSQGLLGRRFMLEGEGDTLTLTLDLTPNFHTRDKSAAGYVDAAALPRNHLRLQEVQIEDNLLRTRLLRAWEALPTQPPPRLLLVLDLGPRGSFRYQVLLQLRFAGGVSLQVLRALLT